GNVVSGNGNNGIHLTRSFTNTVQGNFVGTNAAGTAAVPNQDDGLDVDFSPRNQIGGTVAGAANVFSGNDDDGADINGTSFANHVEGNFFGTDLGGTIDLGNGDNGVEVTSSVGTVLGGPAAGAGNVLANNEFDGVFLAFATTKKILVQGNSIHDNGLAGVAVASAKAFRCHIVGNSIHDNGGLGIDLGPVQE